MTIPQLLEIQKSITVKQAQATLAYSQAVSAAIAPAFDTKTKKTGANAQKEWVRSITKIIEENG